MSAGHVVVVGGGVIGAACAQWLLDAGCQVTVIDQGRFGRGASHANCGYVCPSHVLPLAEPGAVGQTLRAMLRPDSAFSIRCRWDPALWGWLLRFAQRCNHTDMLAAGRAIAALLQSSRALYDQLLATGGLDCDWETRGLLYVYRDLDAWQSFAHTDEILRKEFNVPARRLDATELQAFEPALRPGLAGAWLYEGDAHLRPDRLMQGWKQRLLTAGATLREECQFLRFVQQGSRVVAVETSSGTIAGDEFVIATGAWTAQLADELRCAVPIQPGKGYSLTMARPRQCLRTPAIFPETRVAATPWQSGYRLGSTMEFAGFDTTLDLRRIELLRRGAAPYLHEPTAEPVVEQWWGWRPMTYDSVPIIGRPPAWGNVMLATGHNMLGLSMAPATGRLVAEMILGKTPHVDPAPYAVTRFG